MPDTHADVLARLQAHHTVGQAPREELEWLIAHGTLEHYEPGDMIAKKGVQVDALHILLSGHVAHYMEQGGHWRKALDWRAGEVSGQLPYSRMITAPGNSVVEEPSDSFRLAREHLAELPVACPHLTAIFVHGMVDRARAFKQNDLQVEKMASLGKLAAGLAHELNNPASAATRSARLVSATMEELEAAARALGATQLDPGEMALIDRVRTRCSGTPTSVLSPLERADREDALAQWLDNHDVNDSYAAPLAETEMNVELLDELAAGLGGPKLAATLRWLAAGCTLRGLARDIERAASRVHALVSAVKGFTYMGHAAAPEPVDVGKGLADTLALLAAKARGKAVSLSNEVAADLPPVRGFGGELNQVWANLVDNALDAVPDGGRVVVSARAEGPQVIVRVTDNGPGIPAELKSRIFDPFFTTKPVGQGTGLGLDIVRRLVDQNNGTIEVDSAPGRTEFRVALPT
jgi:signal transduction histidine kinase